MRQEFSIERNTALINFTINYCNTKERLLESKGFNTVLTRYLEGIEKKNTQVYQYLVSARGKHGNDLAVDITTIFKTLLVMNIDEISNINNKYNNYFLKRNLLIEFIEGLYNYWRKLERYSIVYSKANGEGLQNLAFIEANNNFTNLVLSTYRTIEERIIEYNHRVYRQLVAGTNAGIVLTEQGWDIPADYNGLNDALFVKQIILQPPFITYPKRNKRQGIFKEVYTNPLENVKLDRDKWMIYPAKVGESLAFIFFNKDFMTHGITLCNLFELAQDHEYKNRKPDLIYVFGYKDEESKTVFYQDKANDMMVGYASYDEEYDYFGYMKKMILTLHNIRMINKRNLPIHGAMVNIIMKNGKEVNVMVIGDSGAGKSETLEALRMVGNEEIKEMKVVFDDMGTLALENNEIKSYGTEIGAFVRLDDLDQGYVYRTLDRSVLMNPDKINARIVIPVASYEDIMHGFEIDYLFYANNYEDGEEIEFIDDINNAKEIFIRGARRAKGTTNEIGLVESFFANPFGPVQKEKETRELIDIYFENIYKKGIKVGQIRTKLGIDGYEQLGPQNVAKKLFTLIK